MVTKVTTSDIVSALVQSGLSQADAAKAIRIIATQVVDGVKAGSSVRIAGLGVFTKKTKSAGQAKSPSTGQVVPYPATSRIHLKMQDGLLG